MEKEKITVFDKIRLWWKFEGRYYHKDFVHGVKNLWRWFPTIWKDRDWDDSFIWDIMIQKIKNQSKYIGDRDFHTRAKRDAEIMMTCVRLMERVKEEYYGSEYIDYHETKFDFVETDRPEYKRLETTEISENFDEYFKKYPRQYKRVLSGEVNRFKRDDEKDKKLIAMEISIENHNRAKKILFKLMERYIEYWWD